MPQGHVQHRLAYRQHQARDLQEGLWDPHGAVSTFSSSAVAPDENANGILNPQTLVRWYGARAETKTSSN